MKTRREAGRDFVAILFFGPTLLLNKCLPSGSLSFSRTGRREDMIMIQYPELSNKKTRKPYKTSVRRSHFSPLYVTLNPLNGVPKTFSPFESNLTPSFLSRVRFSSSVSSAFLFFSPLSFLVLSIFRKCSPLNPPKLLSVATTRWHGTVGAKGLERQAFPTALGEEEPGREADKRE